MLEAGLLSFFYVDYEFYFKNLYITNNRLIIIYYIKKKHKKEKKPIKYYDVLTPKYYTIKKFNIVEHI